MEAFLPQYYRAHKYQQKNLQSGGKVIAINKSSRPRGALRGSLGNMHPANCIHPERGGRHGPDRSLQWCQSRRLTGTSRSCSTFRSF